MPVLPAEPAVFPENLLDDREAISFPSRRWYVGHTRPRQEKSLARQLCSSAKPFYLPLVARRFRTRGRILTSHVPLFPSYVFLLADAEERVAALATGRLVRLLPVDDQERLWGELRQIQQLIASGAPITPEDRLTPGAEVVVRSGPFAGMQGKVLRCTSGCRFVVQINFIQRGASVLLDDCVLTEVR